LASSLLLALGIATFAGSALAGNGHGNNPTVSESPGNSENAPGQQKNDDHGADANATASQPGVKPTSSTAKGNHNTSCKTGGGTGSSATCTSSGSSAATAQTAAHADASKRYGSGSTAAQVANGRGAPAGTTLSGPGNSQPHKVTDCKHKHAVDVHAVKSYSSASCTTQTGPSTTTKTQTPAQISASTPASMTAAGTSASGSSSTPHGSVLGATASAGNPQGGVLGAVEAVGQGTLPFTGFPLWHAIAAAIVLIALGLTFRRHARATA
jgi:hypothetical protein